MSKNAFWAEPPVLTEFFLLVSPGHLVSPGEEENHNLIGEDQLSWTFIVIDKSPLIILYCHQTCLVLDSHLIQGRQDVPSSLVGSYEVGNAFLPLDGTSGEAILYPFSSSEIPN